MAGSRLEAAGSPTGLARVGYRAPIALYRARLGFLLGTRFLMLEHRGRRTGETRRTVLEVVAKHPHAFYVAAAWKSKSHWLKNIVADPRVTVHCGFERFTTTAEVMDQESARRVLGEYAALHPRTFARLARFMLDDPGEGVEENVERVSAAIPIVKLPKPA